MYTASRTFTFCASHRIEGHPKCGRMHGHNYEVTVQVETSNLDGNGMVIDFGEIDAALKPVFDTFDHRYLISDTNVFAGCAYAGIALRNGDGVKIDCQSSTAEELARLFHRLACNALVWKPEHIFILVKETHRNEASYGG